MTLFGGKVHTGGVSEYVITGVVVGVCAFLVWGRAGSAGGFIPFFYHWGDYYQQGLIDGLEWRGNRFNVI